MFGSEVIGGDVIGGDVIESNVIGGFTLNLARKLPRGGQGAASNLT